MELMRLISEKDYQDFIAFKNSKKSVKIQSSDFNVILKRFPSSTRPKAKRLLKCVHDAGVTWDNNGITAETDVHKYSHDLFPILKFLLTGGKVPSDIEFLLQHFYNNTKFPKYLSTKAKPYFLKLKRKWQKNEPFN